MKPGRELDALVAEKVMDWKLSADASEWLDADGEYMKPAEYWRIGGNDDILPWSPSTDIAAAWQVVEKLADMGYVISVCWGPGLDGRRYASVQMQLDIALAADLAFRNPRDMDAVAETIPLAICLAALKAVNVM